MQILSEQGRKFAQFWVSYPKKCAKQEAWKAWQQVAPDDALLARMLATLAWQVQSADWTEAGGKFIPHPATWLRAGRWDDEPVQVAVPPSKTTGMYKSWVPLKDRV